MASTRRLLPEEYGTLVELEAVVEATKQAMREAGIDNGADVHSVQMKTPSMTPARVEEARGRGKEVCNPNLLTASGMTRGAAALGAAVALGELDRKRIAPEAVCPELVMLEAGATEIDLRPNGKDEEAWFAAVVAAR